MPHIAVNDLELFYEAHGDPDGPPVLLVAGLGVQMIDWADHFIDALLDAGHYVVCYDNRDIGLASTFDGAPSNPQEVLDTLMAGEDPGVAYTLDDMAADAIGLLDALGLDSAHLIGVSMGGMIVQSAAIHFPDRIRSLTSIMSTTGAPDVGQPTAEAMEAILSPAPASDLASIVAHNLVSAKVWASPGHFDAAELERLFTAQFERTGGPQPDNVGRQFCAILASPPRDDALKSVTVPALVVHGNEDTLVTMSGGERTAECLANADLMIVDGMGHDLPPAFTPGIVDRIVDLVARAEPA